MDGFYLLTWGWDLWHYFPFLTLDDESHPYELFYQIWKLSYQQREGQIGLSRYRPVKLYRLLGGSAAGSPSVCGNIGGQAEAVVVDGFEPEV
ncbi:MAG: hypothetical protein ACREBC_20235 [Pyrinomonadaceae bacterium]